MSEVVLLSEQEMRQAAHVGVERCIRAVSRGRKDRHGWDGEGKWGVDVLAAGAELAVAKFTNRFWADSDAPDYDGDVGRGLQVRWTARMDGCLLLHETDQDDHAFLLVCGEMPRYVLAGWIRGHAGKQERWWRTDTGRPAFFVPQSALRPMQTERATA